MICTATFVWDHGIVYRQKFKMQASKCGRMITIPAKVVTEMMVEKLVNGMARYI
jgi:hypothetical protein